MAENSIFDGMDFHIETALGLKPGERLKHKAVCRNLKSEPGLQGNISSLVPDLYAEMSSRDLSRIPSRQNWRLKRITTLAEKNKSPEVVLERAIAIVADNGPLQPWYNQIPVASGLLNDRADKRAAIDLAEYNGDSVSFVELKWESDTPLYAAFEILRYGLAYLLCRDHKEKFGYGDKALMSVAAVELQVLAPAIYYDKCDLQFLSDGIGAGLGHLCAGRKDGLSMTFAFRSFAPDFQLPFTNGKEVARIRGGRGNSAPEQKLIEAMNSTQPVWA
jgi:hypothetical protein